MSCIEPRAMADKNGERERGREKEKERERGVMLVSFTCPGAAADDDAIKQTKLNLLMSNNNNNNNNNHCIQSFPAFKSRNVSTK